MAVRRCALTAAAPIILLSRCLVIFGDAYTLLPTLAFQKSGCRSFSSTARTQFRPRHTLWRSDGAQESMQSPQHACQRGKRKRILMQSTSSDNDQGEEMVDVIVVGAGIGGLSCAALTSALYGLQTTCVETHDTPGGCAHSFTRFGSKTKKVPFQFDSGPSLLSGVSYPQSTNPLRQVLDAVGVADLVEWKTYDGWIVHDYADGHKLKLTTGDGDEFERAIGSKCGAESRDEFVRFRDAILAEGGLADVSAYLPPFAIRNAGNPLTDGLPLLLRYGLRFLQIGLQGILLTGPFSNCMKLQDLKEDFNQKWYDYLAFALSGLDASQTQAAAVAYTMKDLHSPGALLDYPMGGMGSLIQALVTALERDGRGELKLNSRVVRFILDDGVDEAAGKVRCTGVVLEDGTVLRSRRGVVSNVPLWNMAKILQDSLDSAEGSSPTLQQAVKEVSDRANAMEMTGSFMHLHLGIPADGLPEDLECHHSVLDFDKDITAEQNLVIVSIPTVFDPSLAPEGYHIVHAYTAASENFQDWEPFLSTTEEKDGAANSEFQRKGTRDSGSVGAGPNTSQSQSYNRQDGYSEFKQTKAEALWKALEQIIPDIRERASRPGAVVLEGTPLTHRRYNARFRGAYGPAPSANRDIWELPSARVSSRIDGLWACGDTTFPGIGLPAVAASGTIAANSVVDVTTHLNKVRELQEAGILQT